MAYTVKEIFYSLQGEGAQAGRPAVFCRFAGCNLWSGREADRASAICKFCDTDFVGTDGAGGGHYTSAELLASRLLSEWGVGKARDADGVIGISTSGQAASGTKAATRAADGTKDGGGARPFVVCTGGEPLLQMDPALVEALHAVGFEIAIETNGTIAAPAGLDWICVSPKAGTDLVQTRGDELKLVYPQPGAEPERFEQLAFRHFFLQPMDSPALAANTQAALDYCLAHPQWRLSLQLHKLLRIP